MRFKNAAASAKMQSLFEEKLNGTIKASKAKIDA
jgi:hypothetical protein